MDWLLIVLVKRREASAILILSSQRATVAATPIITAAIVAVSLTAAHSPDFPADTRLLANVHGLHHKRVVIPQRFEHACTGGCSLVYDVRMRVKDQGK